MTERIPLITTLFLAGIGLFVTIEGMMSPEIYRVMDPSEPINYVFVPDYDARVGSKHHIEGSFWNTQGDSVKVSVFYRSPGTDYVEGRFQQIAGSNKFSFPLPSLEKGKRFFYFLRVKDSAGNSMDIRPQQNFMDKSFARDKEKLFYVTYEGIPSRSLLIVHVVLIVAAMLLMVHGFHFSVLHILCRRGLSAAYWSLFSGWLLFTVAVFPLGYSIAKSTFGVGWSGFPVGTDITDNKSLGIVVYWLILLLRGWKPQRGEYASRAGKVSGTLFAGFSLLGILLTILAYAIPHSVFVQ